MDNGLVDSSGLNVIGGEWILKCGIALFWDIPELQIIEENEICHLMSPNFKLIAFWPYNSKSKLHSLLWRILNIENC